MNKRMIPSRLHESRETELCVSLIELIRSNHSFSFAHIGGVHCDPITSSVAALYKAELTSQLAGSALRQSSCDFRSSFGEDERPIAMAVRQLSEDAADPGSARSPEARLRQPRSLLCRHDRFGGVLRSLQTFTEKFMLL